MRTEVLMVHITKDHFSIAQICQSGQCFRLERLEMSETALVEGRVKEQRTKERYALTALGRYLEIEQEGEQLSFACPQEEFDQIWKEYFDLEENYGAIIASIDREDGYLTAAAACGSGVRILRQDLWEIIISFIISQQNNIRRIRKSIDLLCRRYGEERQTADEKVYFNFPTAKALAEVPMEKLYDCGLGYRSRYLHETALSILKGEVSLEAVKTMAYQEAKAELLKLKGVGVKVAECICLFALHKTEAFPIDTHINKVLAQQYPKGFPFDRYKGYEGIVQQYIFYYDLTENARRIAQK